MENKWRQSETELERLAQKWAQAELSGDTELLENLLTSEFVGVGPRGFMLSKSQWIERFSSGHLKHHTFNIDEVKVRLYESAAVLTGRQTMTGAHQGKEIDGLFRVSLFLTREQEKWLLAGLQLSPMTCDLVA